MRKYTAIATILIAIAVFHYISNQQLSNASNTDQVNNMQPGSIMANTTIADSEKKSLAESSAKLEPTDAEITEQVLADFQSIEIPTTLAKEPHLRYGQLKPLINATAFMAHEIAAGAIEPSQSIIMKMAEFTTYQFENLPTDELISHIAVAYEEYPDIFDSEFSALNRKSSLYILEKMRKMIETN